jgi:hypothetical protein
MKCRSVIYFKKNKNKHKMKERIQQTKKLCGENMSIYEITESLRRYETAYCRFTQLNSPISPKFLRLKFSG